MEQAIIDEIMRRVPGLDAEKIRRNIVPWEARTLKTLELYTTEDALRNAIRMQTEQLYKPTNAGSLNPLQRGVIYYYIILFERKIEELHKAAAAIEKQKQQEADERALKIGQAIAEKTIEEFKRSFFEMLAKEAEERDRKENEGFQNNEKDKTIEQCKSPTFFARPKYQDNLKVVNDIDSNYQQKTIGN